MAAAAGKVHNTFVYVLLFILFFFATLYHHYLHPANYSFSLSSFTATAVSPYQHHHYLPPPTPLLNSTITDTASFLNSSITTTITTTTTTTLFNNSSITTTTSQSDHAHVNISEIPASISILLPAWEVLVIVSPEDTLSLAGNYGDSDYVCVYPNSEVSAAKPAGMLTLPNRATFKCLLPTRSRRKFPFFQPILTPNSKNPPLRIYPATPELLRWTYVVYDSITTDDDVVVFAKGLNPRQQGLNRDPSEFNCLFYYKDDIANGVKTTVTSSMQEVFRCKRPELTSARGGDDEDDQIKVTLSTQDQAVPTLAYYSPIRKLAKENGKSLLCACTMVYNAAKFLKEWVTYHSSIGVGKFILYDNESDDDLKKTVKDLNKQGFDINIYFWLWPKAQEAGFSHSVVYAKDSCTWMAYIDVDEFIFSPSWLSSSAPSKSMLHSVISHVNSGGFGRSEKSLLGQINIGCYEFGPSNQIENPLIGVTQGYDCRRKYENRHKSIVLLEAIDDSLLTVIHHFSLKKMYKSKKIGIHSMAVNHYKYQAWPEFKAKFRRRVSAYVVDWTDRVNIHSNDRTPGLGFAPVEPPSWPKKFCEVYDYGLKELTTKWFCKHSSTGDCKLVWQR